MIKLQNNNTNEKLARASFIYNNSRPLTKAESFRIQDEYNKLCSKIIDDDRSFETIRKAFFEAADLLIEYKKRIEFLESLIEIKEKTVHVPNAEDPNSDFIVYANVYKLNHKCKAYNKFEDAIIETAESREPITCKLIHKK